MKMKSLVPQKYKKEVLKTNYVWDSGKGLWTSSTVSGILKNPVYTGAVVIRKHERPSYKLKYKKAIPRKKWSWCRMHMRQSFLRRV